jgi:hypothetical protein
VRYRRSAPTGCPASVTQPAHTVRVGLRLELSRPKKDVDPGALVGAVLIFAAVTVVDEGLWQWEDSALSAILAVAVCVFLRPGWNARSLEHWVIGLTVVALVALVLAYPIQEARGYANQCDRKRDPDRLAQCEDNAADKATLPAAIGALVVTPVVGAVLYFSMAPRGRTASA